MAISQAVAGYLAGIFQGFSRPPIGKISRSLDALLVGYDEGESRLLRAKVIVSNRANKSFRGVPS